MPKTLAILAVLVTLLAACAPAAETPRVSGFEALPVGDVTRGEALFAERIGGQATCIGCHSLDGSANVGPTVQGYGQVAGVRVSGQSAEQYTYESIVTPWVHLVPGYSNLMPAAYGQVMTPQDAADLTAYLLSL